MSLKIFDMYRWLEKNDTDYENFIGFCNLITDCKKNDIQFKKLQEEIFKNFQPSFESPRDKIKMDILENGYYISEQMYRSYLVEISHTNDAWGYNYHHVRNFLDEEDYKDEKDFYKFIGNAFEQLLMRENPDYKMDEFLQLKNIGRNQRIQKFCKMVDKLDGKNLNVFEIYTMYRSVYKTYSFLQEIVTHSLFVSL